MIRIIYFLLAVLALLFAVFETGGCTSEGCSAVPGILGRSWYLWGAVFYAVAAMLCNWSRKHIAVGIYLLFGALFHLLLIVHGYYISGEICSVCWKFSAVDSLLALMYWLMPEKEAVPSSRLMIGPAKALGIISLSLLIVNPVMGTVTITDVINQNNLAKTAPITKARPLIFNATDTSKTEHINDESTGKVNCQLRVLTLAGETKCLDITEKPALVFASWCPHCDDALKEVAKLPLEKRPYLIVTYLQEGDVEKARKKVEQNGLGNELFYLAPEPPTGLKAVPSFLYWSEGLQIISSTERREKVD